jgi:hypothetical protein
MTNYNKILIFGNSIVDPTFFNTRVLHTPGKNDDYYFGRILRKITGISDVKTYAVSGCGNTWTTTAIINQLSTIDERTVVIINWGFIDRYDLFSA